MHTNDVLVNNKNFDGIGRMLKSSEDEEIIVLDGVLLCGNRDSQKAGGILNYRAHTRTAGFHFLPSRFHLVFKSSFLHPFNEPWPPKLSPSPSYVSIPPGTISGSSCTATVSLLVIINPSSHLKISRSI